MLKCPIFIRKKRKKCRNNNLPSIISKSTILFRIFMSNISINCWNWSRTSIDFIAAYSLLLFVLFDWIKTNAIADGSLVTSFDDENAIDGNCGIMVVVGTDDGDNNTSVRFDEIGVDDNNEFEYFDDDEDNVDAENAFVDDDTGVNSDTGDDRIVVDPDNGFVLTKWDDEYEETEFVIEIFVEIVLVIGAVEAVLNHRSVVMP